MTRLSQQALSEVSQAFLAAGVSDVRNMETLQEALLLVRSRVRDGTTGTDLASQSHGLARAIQPLVRWILEEPDLAGMEAFSRCDLTWNLYSAALSRTAGADAYPLITNSEEKWNEVLLTAYGVHSFTPEPLQTTCKKETVRKIAMFLLVAGMTALGLDQWVQSGRWRFYMLLSGAMLTTAGLVLLYLSFRSSEVSPPISRRLNPRPTIDTNIEPSQTNNLLGNDVVDPTFAQPPAFAPALPGNAGTAVVQQPPGLACTLSPGDQVSFTGRGESAPLVGQTGIIRRFAEGLYEVELSSGLKVGPLREVCLQKIGAVGVGASSVEPAQPTGQFYAPFALGGNDTKVQMQSGRLKTALEKSSALQSTIPTWGQLFWQAVKNEDDLYGLEQAVRAVLLGHGYIGVGTVSPPRVEELKRQLAQLETLGGPPHGSGGSLLRVSDADRVSDPEQMAWHLKLPADLQRAGPEIYRNIRSEGVTSVRQWVNEQHPGLEQKSSPQYQDLFTTATIIDYEVADCRTEGMLMQKLATSDALEIHLRKLGAFIYLRRTKDKTGANRILGIKAPGTNTDIAPKWLLDDANLHSKTEFQRQERGAKASKYEGSGSGQSEFRQRRGGGRGKGSGKGGGGRKKGGGTTQG